MKCEPKLLKAYEKMKPGVITLQGFLGNDTRELVAILQEDDYNVKKFGLSHEEIANLLEEITNKCKNIMEEEVEFEERYRVLVRDDRGLLPCPFGDGKFRKGDTELYDKNTGKKIRWNELSIHMIKEHGFYNGKGSCYRIEPIEIIDMFFSNKK